jgi:hypothetical protein
MCERSWRTRDSGSRLAGASHYCSGGAGQDTEQQAESPQFLLELTDQLRRHAWRAWAHRKERHAVAGDTAQCAACSGGPGSFARERISHWLLVFLGKVQWPRVCASSGCRGFWLAYGIREIAVLVFFNHDSELSTGPHAHPRVLTLSRCAFADVPWCFDLVILSSLADRCGSGDRRYTPAFTKSLGLGSKQESTLLPSSLLGS